MSGDGKSLLECGGQVRPLPKPKAGTKWRVKAAGSQIPLVTDGTTRQWCMEIFQKTVKEAKGLENKPPVLDLQMVRLETDGPAAEDVEEEEEEDEVAAGGNLFPTATPAGAPTSNSEYWGFLGCQAIIHHSPA